MDYRLEGLSSRSFEQLIQSIAIAEIGPSVVIFGDGPDGGREAAFKGKIPGLGDGSWDGYLVVQAKFRQVLSDRGRDGQWAAEQLQKEMDRYTASGFTGDRPDYYLYVTNVTLTPVQKQGSKDKVDAILRSAVNSKLLKGYDVWDRDKLCRFLDLHSDLRNAYAAWITAGDVLAKVVDDLAISAPDFDRTLSLFLQKELLADQYANLEQAGRAPEERVPIARVFVDLPLLETEDHFVDEASEPRGLVEQLLDAAHVKLNPGSARSLGPSEGRHPTQVSSKPGRWVLIGGPGQGKTTLGQFVCQLFRASLLAERPPQTISAEARTAMALIDRHCDASQISGPGVRRFPIRVVLSEFATALEEEDGNLSLLRFITRRVEQRIDRDVPIDAFRQWLNGYPWLIVLDGLDEVPSSSNRDAVLTAINEFWVDIADSETDALVLATTRPQGYNDDFAPSLYLHRTLAPLGQAKALSYGRQLAEARYGADRDRCERVIGRLERAARVETTARLMLSPLQVTIMATLVDQMGQPPEQRWSLFSEYYSVIYNREMERDIPAADILRRQKHNVDRIHRRVALVLQRDSEVARNTESHLSRDRFASIVRGRLEEEAYEGRELQELCDSILAAAAERLVFVVGVEEDRVGFEIRSLQEFMAAEALMDGGDDVVAGRLRSIASASAWRNVFLFAAGRCFADRQHLRDTVYTICAEQNSDLEDAGVSKAAATGASLAIDLSEDGSARDQPRYRRLLLEQALECVDRPASDLQARLARLYDDRSQSAFRDALEAGLRVPVVRSGTWRLLLSLVDGGVHWAEQMLLEAWPDNGGASEAALLGEMDGPLEIGARVSQVLASAALRHGIGYDERYVAMLEMAAKADVPWANLLARGVRRAKHSFGSAIPIAGVEPSSFRLTMTRVTSEDPSLNASLKEVPNVDVVHPAWRYEAIVGEFVNNPSCTALGDAIDEIMTHELLPYRWGQTGPWPLGACLGAIANGAQAEEIIEAARAGRMGNIDQWRAAEQRWLDGGVTTEDIGHFWEDGLPFDASVAKGGIPLYGCGWNVASPRTAYNVVDAWRHVPAPAGGKQVLARWALAIASLIPDRPDEGDGLLIGLNDFEILVENSGGLRIATEPPTWSEGAQVGVLHYLDGYENPVDLANALDELGRRSPSARGAFADHTVIIETLTGLVRARPGLMGAWRLLAAAMAQSGYTGWEAPDDVQRRWKLSAQAASITQILARSEPMPSAAEVIDAMSAEPGWIPLLEDALRTVVGDRDAGALVLDFDSHVGVPGNVSEAVLEHLIAETSLRRRAALQEPQRWKELELFDAPD
ncbi:MAG TPA: hypothetical protein VHF88_03510 [Thermoleophilaceae bacterium]|nr:hypothetical protein [Thermoleophilaceae bacterium]